MPKSSSFWLALGGHHNMARLQIPMDEKIWCIKGDVLILAWIRNSANGPAGDWSASQKLIAAVLKKLWFAERWPFGASRIGAPITRPWRPANRGCGRGRSRGSAIVYGRGRREL
jgi:hypothetical protein